MTGYRTQEGLLRVLRGEPMETLALKVCGEAGRADRPPNTADLGNWWDRFLEDGATTPA
jgi:hypothetical protein